MVAPFFTSTILPLRTLRALIFMAVLLWKHIRVDIAHYAQKPNRNEHFRAAD